MAGKLEKQLKKKRGFDSPQQETVLGLLRTNDLMQYHVAQLLRQYELTQPQYNILRILRGEGTPLPCLEIADRMITMVPAITGLIDKLEKRKLVFRERCSKDRRVWFVHLTDSGKKLLARLDKPVLDLYQDLCGGLTKTECREMSRLMEKARDHIERTAN